MRKKPQTLYRMYAVDGTLLYVGITQRQMQRFHQHASQKQWWGDVARIDVQHYPDRQAVADAERAAIETERPRHNVVWNGGRLSPARPVVTPEVRDGYGYGAPTSSRWRTEALTCTVLRKRGGAVEPHVTELVLWWELDYEAITDDYLPSEADHFELFHEWERHLRRRRRGPDLPIWWFVVGPNICEYAFPDDKAPFTGSFEDYYYLGDAAGTYQMEVDVLPVAHKRWTLHQADKGGFIQEATDWKPSPLQPSVSLDLLRRRTWARRG